MFPNKFRHSFRLCRGAHYDGGLQHTVTSPLRPRCTCPTNLPRRSGAVIAPTPVSHASTVFFHPINCVRSLVIFISSKICESFTTCHSKDLSRFFGSLIRRNCRNDPFHQLIMLLSPEGIDELFQIMRREDRLPHDITGLLISLSLVSVAPRSGSEQETLPRLIFLVYCPICNIHTLRTYDP